MNAQEEIEKLKKEFVSLNTEEERNEFDKKFYSRIDSKTEKEKEAFADAFVDSAKKDVKKIKQFCNEVNIRLKLEEILGVVSMTYISTKYFNKSKFWFSQKLNGNLKNGIPSSFTEDELKTLSFALDDIGLMLQKTALSIA